MEYGTTTPTLGLRKPDGEDYYTIGDANANADIIDAWAESINARMRTFAPKSTVLDATIPASAWAGSNAPFTAAITVNGIDPENGHYLISDAATTIEQRTAFVAASIGLDYRVNSKGVSTNAVYLMAFFEKPTVDLPIKIEMR